MLLFAPFISACSIFNSKVTFKTAYPSPISNLSITNLTGRVVSYKT